MAGTYELKKTSDGQFMFNLKAANHEIILTSERYTQKVNALNGIESVRTNSPSPDQYEKRTASDGSPYFVLKAKNHEIIGRSEMYSSTGACDNGIQSVMRHGSAAELKDIT